MSEKPCDYRHLTDKWLENEKFDRMSVQSNMEWTFNLSVRCLSVRWGATKFTTLNGCFDTHFMGELLRSIMEVLKI